MKLCCVFPLLLAALPASAADHPGDRFTNDAGFELGHATLADVQARLGASRVHTQGDASEFEVWVCYAGETGEVRFNSGEMGGGTELLGITLLDHSASSLSCPHSRAGLPASIGLVRLGQTIAEFAASVDTVLVWSGKIATALFGYAVETTQGSRLDVSISVLGTFRRGRLAKVQVWKIESL